MVPPMNMSKRIEPLEGKEESHHSLVNTKGSPSGVEEDQVEKLPDIEDAESISLLRQIFPDLSTDELLDLHQNRLRNSVLKRLKEPSPTSPLGRRIWKETLSMERDSIEQEKVPLCPLHWQGQLPDDFLRLPRDVAVRRLNKVTGKWEYHFVADLEQTVLDEHGSYLKQMTGNTTPFFHNQNFTRVLFRDSRIGLGMTLCERGNYVRVHSVTSKNGSRWHNAISEQGVEGPAIDAQIHPGDIVLGINGQAFVPQLSIGSVNDSLLRRAVSAIQQSPDPVVIHLCHNLTFNHRPLTEQNGLASPESSLLDRLEPRESSSTLLEVGDNRVRAPIDMKPDVHPLATALA